MSVKVEGLRPAWFTTCLITEVQLQVFIPQTAEQLIETEES